MERYLLNLAKVVNNDRPQRALKRRLMFTTPLKQTTRERESSFYALYGTSLSMTLAESVIQCVQQ